MESKIRQEAKTAINNIPSLGEFFLIWLVLNIVLYINFQDTKIKIFVDFFVFVIGCIIISYVRQKLVKNVEEINNSKAIIYRSEVLYRSIFENAVDGIFIISPAGKILEVNEAFATMHGYTIEEIQNKNLKELDSKEDSEKLDDRLKRITDGEKLTLEVQHIHKNGHSFPLEVTLSKINFEEESYIQAIYRDISFKKDVEQKLYTEAERLTSITQQVPGMIYQFLRRTDGTYSFLFASESVKDIYRLTPEELYNDGSLISQVIHPDDKPELIKNIKESVSNLSHFNHEYRVNYNDGTVRWLRGSSTPQKLEDGSILWNGYISDITEERINREEKLKLEQHFAETQRLESLGILAGGIAHDFNNILTVIMNYCEQLKTNSNKTFSKEEQILKIENAAQRATNLCKQMLTYAGKKDVAKTHFNMNHEVKEMVNMLRSALKKNITIEYDLRNSTEYIFGDQSQLQQVIMNIIINATESIGEKTGIVKVWLDNITFISDQTHKDFLGRSIAPGKYLCFTIIDNGCGMTEETQKRIFEPFYTTKFIGRGLGMSAILGIVKSHSGAIQIESKIDFGTTIKIYLPDTLRETEEDTMTIEFNSDFKITEGSILLAEDEEELRLIGTDLINDIGLDTILAKNGFEAVENFKKQKDEILLVILDMTMPLMGGSEAYHEIRKITNSVPIIFCSGNDIGNLINLFDNDPYVSFIQKPYFPRELMATIIKMLTKKWRNVMYNWKYK